MRYEHVALVALLATACSEKTMPVAKGDPDDARKKVVVAPPPPGRDQVRQSAQGLHLDDDVPRPAVGVQAVPPAAHNGPPIDITLRSSPAGAQVAVDGTPVGNTPAYWSGVADGREHEFTFDLRGYALARYRFVPVTSGVIHTRLEPIPVTDETEPAHMPNAEAALPGAGSAFVNPPPGPVAPVVDAQAVPVAPPADAAAGSGSIGSATVTPTQPGPQP